MSNNRYGGVDSYAAFFIAYKARTLIRMPMFSRDDQEDLEQDSRPDCGEAIPTQISEVREMTEVEYNAFISRPLAKREWLAGKGGYQGNIKQAIALVCPGRETLYVDPSGSDYGRYVGRAVA